MPIEQIRSQRLDAGESAFFARELDHIKARTYDVKYPEFKARRLLPVNNDAGPGAMTLTWREYDRVGVAQFISNYSDNLPRADVSGRENVVAIRSMGNAYGYSLQEVRSATMAGIPLEQRKANAARQGHEQLINTSAWYGDSTRSMPGMFSATNTVPRVTLLADGTGSSKTFATKTAAQMLRDLNAVATAIVATSLGCEIPDTLLLPLTQYNLIATTQLPNVNMTVLKFFLENSPHIKHVEWLNECAGAGTSGTDVMVAYRNDLDTMELQIPVEFEQLPVQEKGLEFEIPCHSRFGGLIIFRPLSMAIAEGI